MRLELMGILREGCEIADSVIAGAGREQAMECERAQHGIAPGAAAADDTARPIDLACGCQIPGAGHTISHIRLPPASSQGLAIDLPVARAAAVVHVQYGKTPAGPELDARLQGRDRPAGGATVPAHHERRQAARRVPASQGWIVMPERLSLAVGKGQPLRQGNSNPRRQGFGHRASRRPQWIEGDAHNFRPPIRCRRDAGQCHGCADQARVFGPGQIQGPRALLIQQHELAPAMVGGHPDDPVIVQHGKLAHIGLPARETTVHRLRPEIVQTALMPAQWIPPTVHLAQQHDAPKGIKFGLTDGLPGAADQMLERLGTAFDEGRAVQGRRIPGHVRGIPGQIEQPAAVRTDARVGVKIRPTRQFLQSMRAQCHHADPPPCFLAHGQQAAMGRVPLQITEAVPRRRPDLDRPLLGGHQVDPVQILPRVIDEPQSAAAHRKRAAPIFEQPATGAERRRQAFHRRASRFSAEQADSPAFGRASLAPIRAPSEELDLIRHASRPGDFCGCPGPQAMGVRTVHDTVSMTCPSAASVQSDSPVTRPAASKRRSTNRIAPSASPKTTVEQRVP